MALDKLYQQVILDHNRDPHNFGRLPGATHSAPGHDALCGDDILIELMVADGRIEQAAFSGEACAVTKASASMLTDWLEGRALDEIGPALKTFEGILSHPDAPTAEELGEINELRAVSKFPARVRNALLPWRTAIRALEH